MAMLMADFPQPMKISSSNSTNDYSTSPLVPNNLSKHTVSANYFELDGGKEGLVDYEELWPLRMEPLPHTTLPYGVEYLG